MKKVLAFVLASVVTSSAFAISNAALVETCYQTGVEKVIAQAQTWGCEVHPEQVEVQAIDNRWYNPAKYIWFQAVTPCNGLDRVSQIVQYYNGQCF